MPAMRITFIVKDTKSPTTHAEGLVSFCSVLHVKLCFVSMEKNKKVFITNLFNNVLMFCFVFLNQWYIIAYVML